MFHVETAQLVANELRKYKSHLPDERIHLAEDRCFYYRDTVYDRGDGNLKLSLAFQGLKGPFRMCFTQIFQN